ncbi:DNA recombination protein RmuC [Parvibium lacunae]|uniref:DNA recombination protein RmuC n=1 Tax=Parvibium lacunae TaxID=1888893 RepID=A0A368L6V1_9BURK|nr:DNA recombination protein RmuC [Parvibium lacunae]RCS59356.1 DNA recombination protein RmuC [Parvibium lacunae]
MSLIEILLIGLAACVLIGMVWMIWAGRRSQLGLAELTQKLNEQSLLQNQLQLQAIQEAIQTSAREGRGELGQNLSQSFTQFQQILSTQLTQITQLQNNQIDSFAQQLVKLTESNEQRLQALREAVQADARLAREEGAQTLQRFGEGMQQQLAQLSEANARRLVEVRETLDTQIQKLQQDNAAKLEEMRKTVDEKLHNTLETRLGESFKLVSDRLEAVQRGLGEMQTLAAGVGDLKRVLTNVKDRGTWGEVQLDNLLSQLLTPEQFARNVATLPNSRERVEFAIKLPGAQPDQPVWLPIDAKFPQEDYQRLQDAQERADAVALEAAAKALEQRVRLEAKSIREKYIGPPHTTDFALLFLPTEGLYAEVLRRPGLLDAVQREQRVVITGPTTLAAILNSLQMGFRTLAIEQRSSEVWQLLAAVKTEFAKFGDVLDKTQRQIQTVQNSLGEATTRTRAMERKLREVEALPDAQAKPLLGLGLESDTLPLE